MRNARAALSLPSLVIDEFRLIRFKIPYKIIFHIHWIFSSLSFAFRKLLCHRGNARTHRISHFHCQSFAVDFAVKKKVLLCVNWNNNSCVEFPWCISFRFMVCAIAAINCGKNRCHACFVLTIRVPYKLKTASIYLSHRSDSHTSMTKSQERRKNDRFFHLLHFGIN